MTLATIQSGLRLCWRLNKRLLDCAIDQLWEAAQNRHLNPAGLSAHNSRFRTIPGMTITTDHIILSQGEKFEIVSVEDVKGRGMYVEVLAKKVVATDG